MPSSATKNSKTKSRRREFLQLAETYNRDKDEIAGHYISEKLDGTRCFWDGGISRGEDTDSVPYASILDPKTGKRKAKIKPKATGLWSRYGNPIMAPDWFLNALPACPLDGELWAGRGNFQLCRSICGGDTPDPRFDKIQYAVYSTPPAPQIFGDGQIKNANFVSTFVEDEMRAYVEGRLDDFGGDFKCVDPDATFERELAFLRDNLDTQNDHVYLHRQVKLPDDEQAARQAAESFVTDVLDKGGEGAVIRCPFGVWTPKRHRGLLKFKPFEDAEAVIVGFVAGNTGKQGTVHGKIGALICKTKGPKGEVEFEIGTGMTLAERELERQSDFEWAYKHPGDRMPADTKGKHFRRGQTITFKYRE